MLEVTAYGTVSSGADGAEVSGEFAQLYGWATRPGHAWPCSELARLDTVSVSFDSRGDLVDLRATADGDRPTDAPDLGADELSAWTSDVLRAAGLTDHPAIRGDACGCDACAPAGRPAANLYAVLDEAMTSAARAAGRV